MSYNQAHGKMNKSENKPVEKRNEARDMFQGLSVLSRMTWLKDSAKVYTDVSRMVTDITMDISAKDRTYLGNKTRKQLGRLMQSLAQMEKNLATMVTSHNAIVKEMDKAYKAVEGMGSR